jgi:mRNA interferase MazF
MIGTLAAGRSARGRRVAAALDAVESLSVGRLTERLGRLSDHRLREVCAALAVSVDCG